MDVRSAACQLFEVLDPRTVDVDEVELVERWCDFERIGRATGNFLPGLSRNVHSGTSKRIDIHEFADDFLLRQHRCVGAGIVAEDLELHLAPRPNFVESAFGHFPTPGSSGSGTGRIIAKMEREQQYTFNFAGRERRSRT